QSDVALDRIAILRRAAAAIRSGGHLVVISHAAPPPWAGDHHPTMIRARDDAAALDLPSDSWIVVTADERTREAVGPDGAATELVDAVLVLRRRCLRAARPVAGAVQVLGVSRVPRSHRGCGQMLASTRAASASTSAT